MDLRETTSSLRRWAAIVVAVVGIGGVSGCYCAHHHSIPARRLPPEWMAECRNGMVPIDFTLLRQDPPPQYLVGPRDVLGIHIQNMLGAETDAPPITAVPSSADDHLVQPTVGHPVAVQADGTISLPLIPPLKVAGLTIPEVAASIRKAYAQDRKLLAEGQDRISVNLIRPRTTRVMVIRQDVNSNIPVVIEKTDTIAIKRGSASIVELPAYENDVLHALTATGGLPGTDARNEVWVLRNQAVGADQWSPLVGQLQQGVDSAEAIGNAKQTQFTRIPLRIRPEEPAPFGPKEVILQTGDVVFIESRDTEFYYVGGLLTGGKLPLPRDYDLDVLGAIAMAHGNVSGPAGPTSAAASNFRSGPGNVVPPSRVLIVRTLAGGGQVKIDVSIKRALDDPRERVIIQPNDLILLKYTPSEFAVNVGLNTVTFGACPLTIVTDFSSLTDPVG